jgi:hypothetical protein
MPLAKLQSCCQARSSAASWMPCWSCAGVRQPVVLAVACMPDNTAAVPAPHRAPTPRSTSACSDQCRLQIFSSYHLQIPLPSVSRQLPCKDGCHSKCPACNSVEKSNTIYVAERSRNCLHSPTGFLGDVGERNSSSPASKRRSLLARRKCTVASRALQHPAPCCTGRGGPQVKG